MPGTGIGSAGNSVWAWLCKAYKVRIKSYIHKVNKIQIQGKAKGEGKVRRTKGKGKARAYKGAG